MTDGLIGRVRPLADSMEQSARSLLEKRGELLPVVGVLMSDGQAGVIGIPWKDDREKHRMYAAIRYAMLATARRLVGVVLVNDVWLGVLPKGTKIEDAPRPRDMPDRIEAVTITICCLDGSGEIRTLRYVRHGDAIEWGERDVMTEFTSGLIGFECGKGMIPGDPS